MREKALEFEAFELLVALEKRAQPVERDAQAPETRVHLEVKPDGPSVAARALGVSIEAGSRGHGRRQAILDQVRRVAHVKAAQEQHRLLDARRAQLDALLDRGDAEPVHAAPGQALRDRHGAVPISVSLHDRHHLAPAG